jgi:hypothetical protein
MAIQTNLVQVSVPNNEGIVGTPTVFTFGFNQQIVASKLKVTFNIDEKTVIKETRNITKSLKPVPGSLKEGTAELTFPEALAGAVLDIKFSFTGNIQSLPTSVSIKIKKKNGSADVEKVEKVYWSEQESASFGTTLPHRREINKNEWAFLHIYTQGMFGRDMFVQIREYNNEKNIRPIKNMNVVIRDNVVSVPYSMTSAIADFTSKYKTVFEGECLELYARVHPDKTKIDSGEKSLNLFLHYKEEEKNPAKPTTIPPVKVIIAEDEEGEKITTKAMCSLEFRPDNSYIGDYGFDWIRKGDTGATQPFNDHAFQDYMGKHYHTATNKVETNGNKTGDSFKYDKDTNTTVIDPKTNLVDGSFGDGKMYNRLKKRYRKLIFKWNDVSGKPLETYTPIMTLMNGKVAKLNLHLNIKQQPQKIVFEFNNSNANNFLKINNPVSKEITSNLKTQPMEIECTGEFDDEYTLYARAFGKNDPKGEICGMLRILPNGKMYQRKIKITIFNVQTNINGTLNNGSNISSSSNKGKNRIIELLKQALMIPVFEDLDIITTDNNQLLNNCCVRVNANLPNTGNGINSGDYALDENRTSNIVSTLEQKRIAQHGHTHDNAIRLYFLDEVMPTKDSLGNWINGVSTTGFSAPSAPGFTICFGTCGNETASHELFHTLGLYHTFDGYKLNAKFTFKYCKTDNVMDYTHNIRKKRLSLYHWQWQIINIKIR